MNDVKPLQILEARVAKLERAARWYRAGFFAVMVLAVGMGAKFAVQDAEFKIVKAERYEVVTPDGTPVATLSAGINRENNEVEGYLLIANDGASRTTTLSPGKKELTIRNK